MRATKHTPITLELARRVDQLQAEINELKRAVSQETVEWKIGYHGERWEWAILVPRPEHGHYYSDIPQRVIAQGIGKDVEDCEKQINRILVQRFLDTKKIDIGPKNPSLSGKVAV